MQSARYAKIVEGLEEYLCFAGSAPGLLDRGCHGPDEVVDFAELCRIVEEAIEVYHREGKPHPPPTAGRGLANTVQHMS